MKQMIKLVITLQIISADNSNLQKSEGFTLSIKRQESKSYYDGLLSTM
jgi:hypothetical protein